MNRDKRVQSNPDPLPYRLDIQPQRPVYVDRDDEEGGDNQRSKGV